MHAVFVYVFRNIIYLWLRKESLNNNGLRCHQYQQNEQPHLILTELTEHQQNSTAYEVGHQCPDFGRTRKYFCLKLIKGTPTLG